MDNPVDPTYPMTFVVPATGTFGPADPLHPSEISVPQTGSVTDVNVTLIGVAHSFPADLEILLVGPSGEDVTLMSTSATVRPSRVSTSRSTTKRRRNSRRTE